MKYDISVYDYLKANKQQLIDSCSAFASLFQPNFPELISILQYVILKWILVLTLLETVVNAKLT